MKIMNDFVMFSSCIKIADVWNVVNNYSMNISSLTKLNKIK